MSTHELRPGDRVRGTGVAHPGGYLRGGKGAAAFRRKGFAGGGPTLYAVQMEKDPGGKLVIFKADEIEPDV